MERETRVSRTHTELDATKLTLDLDPEVKKHELGDE